MNPLFYSKHKGLLLNYWINGLVHLWCFHLFQWALPLYFCENSNVCSGNGSAIDLSNCLSIVTHDSRLNNRAVMRLIITWRLLITWFLKLLRLLSMGWNVQSHYRQPQHVWLYALINGYARRHRCSAARSIGKVGLCSSRWQFSAGFFNIVKLK